MKKIYCVLACVLLYSCATPIKPISLQHRNSINVELNTVMSAEIGEKLIEKGEEDYQDAYQIINSPNFSGTMIPFPYKNGDVLPLSGETKEWLLYYGSSLSIGSMSYTAGIAKSKSNENIVKPFFNSQNGFITKDVKGFEVKETIYVNPRCQDCYKKEFVYNGKTSNSVKFIYREYINDMARPAFNQELNYDLNESSTVGFKGLRIEIIKATNTNIQYKVLSQFAE